MTKQTAHDISKLMLSLGADLDKSVGRVKEAESEAEFRRYREAVSKIMATMLLEIMNPLYAEHPNLKPAQIQ